ncbi:hypothetical protein [Reyranella sp.]|uniref:hypothetical protein n=1 Tax=Reyranella sp. TaxID=1929291 RepID=UPI003784C56E
MTDNHDKLRSLVRRRSTAPSAAVLETEVRSQGAPNFLTEADPELQDKLPTIAFWEWNYGVSPADIPDFIGDLQNDEFAIITRIEQIIPEKDDRMIEYRGTFISATGERGWYECRTVWAYRGDNPIAQWAQLLEDAQFKLMFRRVRRRWANDPAATERLMSLLQLYTYDDDFVDPDFADGQRALMSASAGLSND